MATKAATGLEIEGEDHIRPVTWDEWITLPIRPQDKADHTVRGRFQDESLYGISADGQAHGAVDDVINWSFVIKFSIKVRAN